MYDALINHSKRDRAIKALKAAGKEVTEESVREEYIKYGGYVHEKMAPQSRESKGGKKKVKESDEDQDSNE